ncbi:hypothetical protein [Butyrivibrio sp. WCE2006]|uniref:hypothetical protein n=1 Tax=Butyrivibrio sp. WCE2006 TaxID=1410611 RepID=UPI0012DEDBAA|nr:hypothetical protein [Butyrivibrio sp. WCE2006]
MDQGISRGSLIMDYDYLSSIVSNYSNLTSLNSLNNKTLTGGSVIKGIAALADPGGSLESLDATSELTGANTFSAILEAAIQSGRLENANMSDETLETLKTAAERLSEDSAGENISEKLAQKLSGIAGAGAESAFDGEARSTLIMQNYLYAAMMKDSLQNSLTDKADFTSGLFSDLAVGTEDNNTSSILGSLRDNTLGAISNFTADGNNALGAINNLVADDDNPVTAYAERGSLLREMLSNLSSELRNIPASEQTQESDRSFDSHLRLRSASYHQA